MIEIKADKYQILKEAQLEVDGLTFLVGSTDQGKSSLIRAVYGALTNQSGSDFIQQGEDKAEVELRFNDDLEVLWEKEKRGSGTYHLNEKKFEKTGKGYFDELLELGFQPVEAGRNDFHIQFWRQMHPFLLLNRPNTRKFEILSCIFDSNKFQDVLDEMKSDRKDTKQEINDTEVRLDQIENQLETKQAKRDVYKSYLDSVDFDFIEERFQYFQQVKEVRNSYFDCKDVLESLEGVVDEAESELERADTKKESCEEKLRSLNVFEQYFDLKDSIEKIDGVKEVFQQIPEVKQIFEEYRLVKKAYQLKQIILSIRDIEEEVVFPDIEEEFQSFKRKEQVIQKFLELHSEKKELDIKKKELEQEINHFENKIEEIEEELGYCPTCGSEF